MLNTKIYWKIRKMMLNWIFNIKKIIYRYNNWSQSTKEYKSFRKILISRVINGLFKGLILVVIFHVLDIVLQKALDIYSLNIALKKIFNISTCGLNIFADVIIAEVGVSGVILGLYCSNISSVYSTRYSNAPEKISRAFQYDRLTVKCMNNIIGFIIYGTIVLIELMLGWNVGYISGGALIIWSLVVVISYGIAGNRTYQLSDIFKVSDDAFALLNRVVAKNLNKNIYSTDSNYQNHFSEFAAKNIELLKVIQKYGCSIDVKDNTSMVNFMCKNLALLEQYWKVKKDISRDSFWFRRKGKYQKWHLANSSESSIALKTGTALRPKEEPNYYWFEDEIMSINHVCINYLVGKGDFESIYNYLVVFESICKTAIVHKEANYYVGQIDWLKKIIQKIANEKKIGNSVAFAGIIEYISVLYLGIILEASKYLKNLDINSIYKSIQDAIDSGKRADTIKEICGRDNIELYKKILLEVSAEGHRITPDWLIKQYVAKEEYVYMNCLLDMVKEGVEHAYSLGTAFVDKKMYYEACILLTRFYEYESKLSNFYKFAEQKYEELQNCHLEKNDRWDNSRLGGVKEMFLECKKALPELLLKCASEFVIRNWDCGDDYPDFLGECYNHISEDAVEAIVNNDKEQYERNFENLTKLMLLYQEYIRSDFIKNKDLYRVEYAYYMFTSPIVEWAQIGGLGILWGEFFKDKDWSSIVNKSFTSILKRKEDDNSIELAEKLIEFVRERNKFMFGIASRDILETSWNQYVADAIRKSENIKTEDVMFERRIKTDSKLINAFCPNFLDMGFTTDPSEVFWAVCVNPLLPDEKRFHTSFSWEDKLGE